MRHLLLAFALLSGCAHVDRVSYTPQPGRIVDPRAELQAFIKQNTVQGCLTEPVFEGATLDVKWVCSRALGHAMVRLDRVVSIDIDHSGEWYRLTVHHSTGIDDFEWESKSLEDIQRAADALDALSGQKTSKGARTAQM